MFLKKLTSFPERLSSALTPSRLGKDETCIACFSFLSLLRRLTLSPLLIILGEIRFFSSSYGALEKGKKFFEKGKNFGFFLFFSLAYSYLCKVKETS